MLPQLFFHALILTFMAINFQNYSQKIDGNKQSDYVLLKIIKSTYCSSITILTGLFLRASTATAIMTNFVGGPVDFCVDRFQFGNAGPRLALFQYDALNARAVISVHDFHPI